jgi:major membrane immunogen (membrane-anchored lipoprotein)
MKKLCNVLLVSFLLLSACNSSESNTANEKEKYQEAKETLEEKERKNPAAFLLVDSHDKRNLIGQTVVKGRINNIAKVCVYKDVELELSFYSKTGTLLIKTNETVYDKIEPGKSASFKAKEFAPKGSDSVAIKVLRAKTN